MNRSGYVRFVNKMFHVEKASRKDPAPAVIEAITKRLVQEGVPVKDVVLKRESFIQDFVKDTSVIVTLLHLASETRRPLIEQFPFDICARMDTVELLLFPHRFDERRNEAQGVIASLVAQYRQRPA